MELAARPPTVRSTTLTRDALGPSEKARRVAGAVGAALFNVTLPAALAEAAEHADAARAASPGANVQALARRVVGLHAEPAAIEALSRFAPRFATWIPASVLGEYCAAVSRQRTVQEPHQFRALNAMATRPVRGFHVEGPKTSGYRTGGA